MKKHIALLTLTLIVLASVPVYAGIVRQPPIQTQPPSQQCGASSGGLTSGSGILSKDCVNGTPRFDGGPVTQPPVTQPPTKSRICVGSLCVSTSFLTGH